MYTVETALLKLSYFIDGYLLVKGALTLKNAFQVKLIIRVQSKCTYMSESIH